MTDPTRRASAKPPGEHRLALKRPLKMLTPGWIRMIDEGLAWIGAFGELRLVVDSDHLVELKTTRSYDALKGLVDE